VIGVSTALTRLYLRAGGGHNFGGGGHSSGGSSGRSSGFRTGSSSSSSSSGGIGGLIVLIFIVLIIVLIVWAVRRGKKKAGGSGTGFAAAAAAMAAAASSHQNPAPPAPTGPATNGVAAGLDAIRAHDPGFEDDKFITDAQRSFFTVQQAWTELKPEMSRRVMADNIWQQHKVQIESYKEQHKRNVLEGLAIANANIIKAESEGGYDTIVLRLHAGCADYDVDTESNKVVRGNHDFTQWTEDWCFQRSSEATTKQGGGTMQQRCPNCGAPLDLDLAGVCKYCHEAVMSGKYDWVLTRIDQVST
jgi:predicted lipid-binding transport protein (Tim44 family)